MTEFWEYAEQKLDLSEIDSYPNYPYEIIEYNSIRNVLHRVIGFGEIKKSFDLVRPSLSASITEHVADLKSSYLVFDAKHLYSLGYKEIYYKDLAPGDTSIVYELRVGDDN